jgi:hypothetical protein
MRKNLRMALLACALAIPCAGCGEANGLYPVYGKVNFRGEPAVGATVYFHRTGPDGSGGPIARGEVQSDGSFWLESGDAASGALPGQYAVLVEWRQGPLRTHRVDTAKSVGAAAAREGKPLLIADDRLQGRYFDASHPRITAEVKAEKNTLPTIELND